MLNIITRILEKVNRVTTVGCVKFLACGDSGRHGIAEFAENTEDAEKTVAS